MRPIALWCVIRNAFKSKAAFEFYMCILGHIFCNLQSTIVRQQQQQQQGRHRSPFTVETLTLLEPNGFCARRWFVWQSIVNCLALSFRILNPLSHTCWCTKKQDNNESMAILFLSLCLISQTNKNN